MRHTTSGRANSGMMVSTDPSLATPWPQALPLSSGAKQRRAACASQASTRTKAAGWKLWLPGAMATSFVGLLLCSGATGSGLVAFLDLPGNARLRDRVVQIDGVKRMQQDRRVWAVLVGVCQFAQHYDGYRPRANCILEFDPSKGFNNGSAAGGAGVSAAALRLKVATRNGGG